MKLGTFIKQYRESHNISQRQFAKLCHVSNGYISMLEEGINPKTNQSLIPSLFTLKKIASAMNTTVNDLVSQTDDMNIYLPDKISGWNATDDLYFNNIFPLKKKRYPLLGKIACGKPIYAEENRESYVESGADIKADFCLRASSDSMINARILDGDIVFIRNQPMVDNGDIAAVVIDDEATLKRVYYYPEKGKLILQAENPKYEPLVYIGEELNDIRILGKAIAFESDIK